MGFNWFNYITCNWMKTIKAKIKITTKHSLISCLSTLKIKQTNKSRISYAFFFLHSITFWLFPDIRQWAHEFWSHRNRSFVILFTSENIRRFFFFGDKKFRLNCFWNRTLLLYFHSQKIRNHGIKMSIEGEIIQ